ncbi:DoxX family protein [Tenacibaculum sp. TC6]|uniref:DoxX family protein n=1 Tax=Tenacibaculum sp. TC6 TaxID=3423223 RepID=UPI003D36796A
MKPLVILLITFTTVIAFQKLTNKTLNHSKAGQIAISFMLLFTAMGHFLFTEGMSKMIPDFLPYKRIIVLTTGYLEIAFSIGILFTHYKLLMGWALIIFLILIIPSNIKASLEHLNFQTGSYDSKGILYLWFRIPLQLFFIFWVYFFLIRKY